MKRLLYWITGFLPCRIIADDGIPYLERYYLFTACGVRFYIHRFVGSDPDRGLHCHPWRWAGSVILSGWYFEETRYGLQKVRWFNWLTGESFHRVVLPCEHMYPEGPCADHIRMGVSHPIGGGKPCWTLFFHRAAYTKPWGFLRPLEGEKVLMWWPFNYPKDGSATPGEWWNQVPQGRFESRRAKL